MRCGQNRAAVTREFKEKSPIRVQRPATGRSYDFSAANPVRLVDAQDAESLLRPRFFTRGN
jgi:hypothetical protein